MYQKQITITKEQLKTLTDRANKDNNETCAILLGKNDDFNHIVQDAFLAENVAHSPVYFEIDGKQDLKIAEYALSKRLEVVGIFHSHPLNTAYPSATDQEYMHEHPTIWVIYSCVEQRERAFILMNGEIEQVEVISE